MKRTHEELVLMQELPLDVKVMVSKTRIREWLIKMHDVYVSFSGGKDSTVLLDLVQQTVNEWNAYTKGPSMEMPPAVFVDTGLEYPEIRAFIKKTRHYHPAPQTVIC